MINQAIIHDALLIANTLVGTKEEIPNSGKVVDEIQANFGYHQVAYCVLFCLYCYKKACQHFEHQFPLPITVSSQTLFEWAKKKNFIHSNIYSIEPGDIVIYRKFLKWSGHAGLVTSFLLEDEDKKYFRSIEGNTSNSDYGNQSDGDGIYRRKRSANKLNFAVDSFWLRGFVSMRKVLESV